MQGTEPEQIDLEERPPEEDPEIDLAALAAAVAAEEFGELDEVIEAATKE